jgi:hypothetical protein
MKIEFSTDNAAFKDEYADKMSNDMITRDEVARILSTIITRIRCGDDHGPIMDINGNKIGEWSL